MPKRKKTNSQTTRIIIYDPTPTDSSAWKRTDPAKIGTNKKHTIKPKITPEIAKQPCESCKKPATEDQTCQKCGKPVRDKCAKVDSTGRYCPACFDELRSLSKLA